MLAAPVAAVKSARRYPFRSAPRLWITLDAELPPAYSNPLVQPAESLTIVGERDYKEDVSPRDLLVKDGEMVDATTWLTEANPRVLLEFLHDRSLLSRRKDRLIACACCRWAWPFLFDERSRQAVEAAERFADGAPIALEHYYQAARAVADERMLWGVRMDGYGEASAAHDAIATVDDDDSPAYLVCRDPYVPGAADIIRDIAGNPFSTLRFDPAWPARHGGIVRTMATTIYDNRTFGDLPILADALEDVGCDSEEILRHCRGGGEHFRGCWALDLLLGRS